MDPHLGDQKDLWLRQSWKGTSRVIMKKKTQCNWSELEKRGLIHCMYVWWEAKVTAQNRGRWWALVEDLCFIKNEKD